MRRAFLSLALAMVAAVAGPGTHPSSAQPEQPVRPARPHQWVGTWASAMTPPGTTGRSATGFKDQTVRMVIHTSASGDALRLRLSNRYGTRPLDIGAIDVAAPATGASTVPGSHHAVTFAGVRAITIPAGADVVSDPVGMPVAADTNVVVSVYLPTETGPATWHGWAKQTSYVSAGGDHTADDAASAYPDKTTSWFFLSGMDVSTTYADGTVVAFGDSITEGGATANDSNRRWTDDLARRLAAQPPGHRRLSVVNEGIGGNRVLTDAGQSNGGVNLGLNAEARFGQDAIEQTAARDVIFLEGTNDLGKLTGAHPGETLTAGQLIAGIANIVARAHAAGLAIYGGTITPNGKLTPAAETVRTQVNTWIRTGGAFDGVIDFDAALRDPADPARLLPAYDSGDHVHPTDAGLQAMADAVDLTKLRY